MLGRIRADVYANTFPGAVCEARVALTVGGGDYFPGEERECDHVVNEVGVKEPEDKDELRDA